MIETTSIANKVGMMKKIKQLKAGSVYVVTNASGRTKRLRYSGKLVIDGREYHVFGRAREASEQKAVKKVKLRLVRR